jgi:hypothetical protein
MSHFLLGLLLILHGIVHFLYFAHSSRMIELASGLLWPDESIVLRRFFSVGKLRLLAGILCIISALAFISGGVLLFLQTNWWFLLTIIAIIVSSITWLLFWNGKLKKLHDQGFIGLLFNLAILVVSLWLAGQNVI